MPSFNLLTDATICLALAAFAVALSLEFLGRRYKLGHQTQTTEPQS